MTYYPKKTKDKGNHKAYPSYRVYVTEELNEQVSDYLTKHSDLDKSKLVRAALRAYMDANP